MRPSTAARRLWSLTFSACVFLAGSELAIRWTGIDWKLLAPVLNYQMVDLELHRPSPDPRLLYEMRPRSAHHYDSNPPRTVTINSLGMRNREVSAAKPPGVFRIICVGSSNTYGALVNDAETYPAQMEALLNADGRRRFEVWNAGLSADSFFQDAIRAEELVRLYHPDLVLFQVYNVAPRKHFLVGQDFVPYFEEHPELYRDFLVPVPFVPERIQTWLLAHVRLYKVCVILMNYIVRDPHYTPPIDPYEEYRRFYARLDHRIPVVLCVNIPLSSPLPPLPAQALIRLYEQLPVGHGPEYLLVHPPAHVYAWYARTLVSDLRKAGLLPR